MQKKYWNDVGDYFTYVQRATPLSFAVFIEGAAIKAESQLTAKAESTYF